MPTNEFAIELDLNY